METKEQYLLEAKNLSKYFPGQKFLRKTGTGSTGGGPCEPFY